MTQNFSQKMHSLGYTEKEARQQWSRAMSKADEGDPIYKTMVDLSRGDYDAAREEYTLSQIEYLEPKNTATVSSDPLTSDAVGRPSA